MSLIVVNLEEAPGESKLKLVGLQGRRQKDTSRGLIGSMTEESLQVGGHLHGEWMRDAQAQVSGGSINCCSGEVPAHPCLGKAGADDWLHDFCPGTSGEGSKGHRVLEGL